MESGTTSRLPWKWILEKLVDLSDFGETDFNEAVARHITEKEEPFYLPLLEKVALRNLEEMVMTNQIDSGAIPLLEMLTGQDLGPRTTIPSSSKQRFKKELVLRVRTELVLSVLRKDVDEGRKDVDEGQKDWAYYEVELERIFKDAEEDNRILDRKRELISLLKPKNQTKANVAAFLLKYSLNKLRYDLSSFIDEKKESFKTPVFLKQFSRDFLDANEKPFTEDVEKSTNLEVNGKQDHLRQNPTVSEIGDQHIVQETATISGKKRLRRKQPTQDNIGNSDLVEAEEDSERTKKSRKLPLASIVEPSLRHGVSASGRQKGCFPVNQEVESGKQLALLNRDDEHVSDPRSLMMRNCSPVAQKSISMNGAKISPMEPSRTNEYVVISDVESDAETQVVERLSTHDEDNVKVDSDMHKTNGNRSLFENGSDRERPQKIVEADVLRKETLILQSEQMILPDRTEAFTGSPELKSSSQEDHRKIVTKNKFIPLDSQDVYAVDLLEVGSDGHEDVCHTCRDGGDLYCCGGCPISMHITCIDELGLGLPNEESWYCPVCMSLRAAREAEEAEKAAAVAKKNLKAFKMKSQKRRSFTEGNNNGQENAGKQLRPTISSLQFGENDKVLKAKQQIDDEAMQGQQGLDPYTASLIPAVLRSALHKDSDHASPEGRPGSNRVVYLGQGADDKNVGRAVRANEQLVTASPKSLVKNGALSIRDESAKPVSQNEDEVGTPHQAQLSHDREVSGKDPCAASASGDVRSLGERLRRFSNKNEPEVDSDERNPEKAGSKVAEPASGPGGCKEMKDDEDDEELDEDSNEDRNQAALVSGRRKVPGVRRRPLPWTRQEELTLKEGVKRFSNNGSWGFQWTRILQFGRGRFDPSRTDVDLKDKWRNLVKGVS